VPESKSESWQQRRDRKRVEVSHQIEDLTAIMKQLVLDLRGEPGNRLSQEHADLTAYARVYWLRKQLGYLTRELGYDAPATWATKFVEKEYGTELTRFEKRRLESE
jgi:hypothetical protein